jgi:acetate---CoA ligase (ADP-forming)
LTLLDPALSTPRGADLRRLIRPASVAVVGATDRPGSYAAEALLNLRKIGFTGSIWGVNPGRSDVFGHACVPSVLDLPDAVDAILVAVPAAVVPEVIDQAGQRGCGGAVVISAGFAEVAAGVELQRELVAAAVRHQLPVCGPNCNGIVSPHTRTALWGDALEPSEPGAVALISQSGNVAVNALAARRGLRFHTVIASGNQAVLSTADYLSYLAGEDGVGAIALYLEDDGGPGLCDGLAACVDASVPVVVLKVGRSIAGARAAAAHSGALAGDQRVFRSLLEEAGAHWAGDVHELLELSKVLAVRRPAAAGQAVERPRAGGLAIMTCSGGDSAQGADAAEALGIDLPELSENTCARLAELLPPAATVGNPLDYTAMIWGDSATLGELVEVVGEDPAVDQVLVFYDQPAGLEGAAEASWRAVRVGIVGGAARSPVPTLVSSTLPELLDDAAAWEFASAGVATAAGLRTGVLCAGALLAAREPRDAAPRLHEIGEAARSVFAGASGSPRPDGERPESGAGVWLAEHEAKQLLREAGVPVPAGRVVNGADDAVAARRELDGPLALKLSSVNVQHKSELGGVELRCDAEADVRAAYGRLAPLVAQHGGCVLAERMAVPGLELIVAAHADGVVPALVVGLGGIWTELLGDVVVVPLPAEPARVERALRDLRGAPLLYGGRGAEGIDVDAIADLASRIGGLLLEHAWAAVECNPVVAGAPGAGAMALDAVIRLREAG